MSSTITPLVRQHYNTLEEKGIDARRQSRIYHLRSFNNWIKSMLISDAIKRLSTTPTGEQLNDNLTVLDMCCGKGGDIQKWLKSRSVGHVVFIDLAETSVAQCKDRYSNLHRNQRIFSAEFATADCTKDTLSSHFSNPSLKVDLVSCQFSFHYCFESIEQTMKMLDNIAANLRTGGYFVGTTPNANRIVNYFRRYGPQFGNDVFNIQFVNPPSSDPTSTIPIFGAKYYFQLDEVVNCPEFLVHFGTLEKLAREHFNLHLVYKHTFEEYFKMKLNEGHFLLDKMQALQTYPPPASSEDQSSSDNQLQYEHASVFLKDHPSIPRIGTLSKSEWETASLYFVFAFQKRDQ